MILRKIQNLTLLMQIIIQAAIVRGVSSNSTMNIESGVATTTLSNGKIFPLVGLGVGSAQSYLVSPLVAQAMQGDKKTMLFDTAQQSANELFVSSGIINGISKMDDSDEKIAVHVVTKVWYTHLGYERTILSIHDSFKNFKAALDDKRIDLKVHILLHWPRCYDHINFMDCEGEEENLSYEVREAGPSPHLDKDNAWKRSWRALEDMYNSQEYPIESVGVSNFQLSYMKQFELFATIQPHVVQMNVWSLLYDPELIDYCHTHKIHVQVYNVMNLAITGAVKTPHANHHVQKVASDLSENLSPELTTAQVVLAWLIQHGVSIIPRTSQPDRLQENSAISLALVPEMSDYQVETVAHSVEAFLSGQDLEEDLNVMVTFEAKSRDLMLYWKRPDGSEVHIAYIQQGEEFNETTYPKHNYRVYDAQNKESFIEYKVQGKFGTHETVPL